MPAGFSNFASGCPGLSNLGFTFDASGCNPASTGYALFQECGFTCPLGQYAEVEYNESTDFSGPAIRMTAESAKDNATLLAAIYVPDQEVVLLVLLDGESLIEITEDMVLSSVARTLTAGDVLGLYADEENPEQYRVKVNGATIISRTITDETLSIVNPCIGFVVAAAVPTIDIGEDGDVMVVVKTSDETRVNTTTLTNDSDLVFAIGANEKWAFHFHIFGIADSVTPDLAHTITAPAGASGTWADINENDETLDIEAETWWNTQTFVEAMHLVGSVQNGATAGVVAFKWAQHTLHATDEVTVKANSHVIAFKQA